MKRTELRSTRRRTRAAFAFCLAGGSLLVSGCGSSSGSPGGARPGATSQDSGSNEPPGEDASATLPPPSDGGTGPGESRESGPSTSSGAEGGTGDDASVGVGSTPSDSGSAPMDSSATATGYIQNDVFWKDTTGNPIYSEGGGILQVGAVYYWYGVKYQGAVTYAAKPTKDNSDTTFASVTCYSSSDLVHWKFENDVLLPGNLAPTWLGRLGVAYNQTTKLYVLVSQYTGAQGSGELFATSATPTGTFAFDHVQTTLTNVVNGSSGDQSLFVDDDGQAYLVLSSSMGRANLYVAPLHPSDFLSVDSATKIFSGPGREGNCMFKYGGRYYFNSSDLHGWNASHTYTISATSILGPYSAESVMANTDADFSHVSQTGFFVTVKGTAASTVIFAGDRWSAFAGNGLGYNQWNPLTFDGTTPQFQSVTQWSLDATAGTWAVGPANNYALNPSFEADRVTMTQPAGWVTSTTTSGATPYTNLAGGRTGNWKWRLTDTAAYEANISQTVAGLPSGSYTLSAWIQSSGGQSVAHLFARAADGTESDASLTAAISSWKQVSIPGIAVAQGSVQIGVETTAAAGQWIDVDDVALTKN